MLLRIEGHELTECFEGAAAFERFAGFGETFGGRLVGVDALDGKGSVDEDNVFLRIGGCAVKYTVENLCRLLFGGAALKFGRVHFREVVVGGRTDFVQLIGRNLEIGRQRNFIVAIKTCNNRVTNAKFLTY